MSLPRLSSPFLGTNIVARSAAAKLVAGRRRPAGIIRAGFALLLVAVAALIPLVPSADSGSYLVIPLMLAGVGLGMIVRINDDARPLALHVALAVPLHSSV